MNRNHQLQMTRTKAAFDVVKNKLMKNIEERAGNLKAHPATPALQRACCGM